MTSSGHSADDNEGWLEPLNAKGGDDDVMPDDDVDDDRNPAAADIAAAPCR